MPNMKSLSLTVKRLLTTYRQTERFRQTDRQDKNNMPTIIRSGGIKSSTIGKLMQHTKVTYFAHEASSMPVDFQLQY